MNGSGPIDVLIGLAGLAVLIAVVAGIWWLGRWSNKKEMEEKVKRYQLAMLAATQDPRIKALFAHAVAECLRTEAFKLVVQEMVDGPGTVPSPDKVYYEDVMKERIGCA